MLLHIDGFDHYGDDESNLVAGAYSQQSSVTLRTTYGRTGGACLGAASTDSGFIRKALGGAKTTVGVGYGIRFPSLPVSYSTMMQFRDNDNTDQVTISLSSTGTIRATRGSSYASTLLGETASPALNNGTWNHVEIKAVFSQSAGAIEIRVNESTVLNLTGIDTVATSLVECSQITINPTPTSTTGEAGIDDLFIWDGTGTSNNDFIGDRRVFTMAPNSNSATQQWSVTGAGSAYQAIDDAVQDGDTSYIEASDSVPVTSEFGFADADASVGAIAGVQTVVMARRVEAVSTAMQVSLLSNGEVDAGATHSIGDTYAYYSDVSELDPDTGAPWTRTALNAATLRLRRTT